MFVQDVAVPEQTLLKADAEMRHAIVHFELPADDVARAKAFYSKLFDWKITSAPGFEDYWFV
jgi:predicted enzyme related to lactoylglutathione lyase